MLDRSRSASVPVTVPAPQVREGPLRCFGSSRNVHLAALKAVNNNGSSSNSNTSNMGNDSNNFISGNISRNNSTNNSLGAARRGRQAASFIGEIRI